MLTLHQFSPAKEIPNYSPFCLKLETYVKLSKIPYENKYHFDLGSAPKKKMPYIEENGHLMGDSTLIIDHLKEQHGDSIDAHLNTEQRAVAVAFQRLLEDNLAPAMAFFRWVDEPGWERFSRKLFPNMPMPLALFVPRIVRRKATNLLWAQGMARHKPEEVLVIARKDLQALADFLKTKPYFFNDQVSTLDIISFSVLGNIRVGGANCPLAGLVREHANLEAHMDRVKKLAWS